MILVNYLPCLASRAFITCPPTWKLLDSSVGTTPCPPLDLKWPCPPINLLTASITTVSHTNTAAVSISACNEVQVKSLRIQVDLHCCFAFLFLNLSYPAPIFPFYLNHHLPSLGPENHTVGACLFLFPPNNRVFYISITPDIRLSHLILRIQKAAFSSSATWKFWWIWQKAYCPLIAHLMLICLHHAFQRTGCPLPPF